jgi:hypothetical protein
MLISVCNRWGNSYSLLYVHLPKNVCKDKYIFYFFMLLMKDSNSKKIMQFQIIDLSAYKISDVLRKIDQKTGTDSKIQKDNKITHY